MSGVIFSGLENRNQKNKNKNKNNSRQYATKNNIFGRRCFDDDALFKCSQPKFGPKNLQRDGHYAIAHCIPFFFKPI
jgi:hypothetical protein